MSYFFYFKDREIQELKKKKKSWSFCVLVWSHGPQSPLESSHKVISLPYSYSVNPFIFTGYLGN